MRHLAFTTVFLLASSIAVTPAAAQTSDLLIQQTGQQTGRWILRTPDGNTIESTQTTKLLSRLPSGTYRISVRSPEGAVAVIRVYRHRTILQSETAASTATFTIPEEGQPRVTIQYKQSGTIRVDSAPEGVPFTIKGPHEGTWEGVTPKRFTDMQSGRYTVHYDTTPPLYRSTTPATFPATKRQHPLFCATGLRTNSCRTAGKIQRTYATQREAAADIRHTEDPANRSASRRAGRNHGPHHESQHKNTAKRDRNEPIQSRHADD